MEDIDFTEERIGTILLNGMNPEKMEKKYYLYFDETGNCRRFRIKEGRYNVTPPAFFVLGGVATTAASQVDVQTVREKLCINSVTNEIKAKCVFHGKTVFEDCLKQESLKGFLDLIIGQDWYFHFGTVDLFYYAIVDIIDSLVKMEENTYELKNELYKILCDNLEDSLHMMVKFEYPDIKKNKISDFIKELTDIIDKYITNTGKATEKTYKLRCYVMLGKDKEELIFIQDEEKCELLHDFTCFYYRPIYLFTGSKIFFDQENNIEEMMENQRLVVNGNVLNNFQFVDSRKDIMIQLSDVFVGLMAKYLQFINSNVDNVEKLVSQFDNKQISSFRKFNFILDKSINENEAFWDMFVCQDVRRLLSSLVNTYGKIESY